MLFDCKFCAGAKNIQQIPDLRVPEIAFAGRSNVGKSSLINAITSNKKNARISSHPGSTRQINFYLNKGVLALVDLPGYGYSKASKDKVDSYLAAMEYYLTSRETLQRLVLLIDCRVGLKDIDLDFLSWLETRCIAYSIVLTKTDKLSCSELSCAVLRVEDQLKGFCLLLRPIFGVSSKTGKGIKEFAHEVTKFVG